MNEPRRLSRSGGVSQRLLDSASLDVPSQSARRKAATLAATASSFTSTNPRAISASVPRANVIKTLATWTLIGAAASGTLALIGSKLFDATAPSHQAAAPPMAELPPAPNAPRTTSPEISPEPNVARDPAAIASTAPQPAAAAPSASASSVKLRVPSLPVQHLPSSAPK